MCPPALTPPDDIGLHWTNEQKILLLNKVMNGSAPPKNVYEDINPYQYLPSNMPSKIWYLVRPTMSKKTEHGFWKEIGEACEIYQNPAIYGWKTTLEFFEGPDGRKTDWVMQEYKITQMEGQNENNLKQSTALCTVFHCCNGSPNNGMQLVQIHSDSGRENLSNSMLSSVPNTNGTSGVGSTSKSQAKSNEVDTSKDAPDDYKDCILSENYIELNDLHTEALIDQILNEDLIELADLTESNRQSPAAPDDYLFDCILGENYIEMNDLDEDKAKDPHSEALIDQISNEDFMELDDLTESIRQSPPFNKALIIDPIPKEEFLEQNDLDGIVSLSSSSGNSSHRSLASDDDFFATVRNMDDENNGNQKAKDHTYQCWMIMGHVPQDDVIMHPATLGSLIKGTGSEPAVETLQTSASKANTRQSAEMKVHRSLLSAATKKRSYGVTEKLYCDCRGTKKNLNESILSWIRDKKYYHEVKKECTRSRFP